MISLVSGGFKQEESNISTEKKLRINNQIRAREVRLIARDGEQIGVTSIQEALELAKQEDLDLVEISPNAAPPVCRIMDHGKHLYQLSKKKAAAKKKQRQSQVKELKIRPSIEEGDYQVKLRKLLEFIDNGDKVKITMRFRGREIAHNDLGVRLLDRLTADIGEAAMVEQTPRFEGRQMVMVIAPKKKV